MKREKLSLHFFSQRREPGRGRGLGPGGRAGHPAQAQAEAIQDHLHRIPVGKWACIGISPYLRAMHESDTFLIHYTEIG